MFVSFIFAMLFLLFVAVVSIGKCLVTWHRSKAGEIDTRTIFISLTVAAIASTLLVLGLLYLKAMFDALGIMGRG